MKIVKSMNLKKHRNAGYSFELEEIEDQQKFKQYTSSWYSFSGKEFYKEYKLDTVIFRLKIFYEKPDETLTDKNRVTRRVPRK